MSGDKMYVVDSSDDENIYLKRGGVFVMQRITVPRDQVASVSSSFVEIRVHTTGGAVYRVTPGVLRKYREAASAAFAQWGVKV